MKSSTTSVSAVSPGAKAQPRKQTFSTLTSTIWVIQIEQRFSIGKRGRDLKLKRSAGGTRTTREIMSSLFSLVNHTSNNQDSQNLNPEEPFFPYNSIF